VGQLVTIGGLLGILYRERQARFGTLTGPTIERPMPGARALLRVAFQEHASEREIRVLLQQLEASGISSEIVDVTAKSDAERIDLYLQATLPTARTKYRVRQVFGSKRHAGSLFGKEVPALLVYEPGAPYPIDVYPHRSRGRTVTIRAFLESLIKSMKGARGVVERKPDKALAERMDRLREKIGPIGVRVVELVREGRRR